MTTPWTAQLKDIAAIGRSTLGSWSAPAGFTAPALPTSITLAPADMFLAMAKCAAITSSDPVVAKGLEVACAALLGAVVDDSTRSFDVVDAYFDMVDFQRSSLAGLVGGGFAHLMMQALGYVWCDQANRQIKVARGLPLADFVYCGGAAAGFGNVLVEAKGSIAGDVDARYVERRAEDGLRRQVMTHLGAGCAGGHAVIYGYAVGFGAAPVDATRIPDRWAGAHVAAIQPVVPGSSPPRSAGVTGSGGSSSQPASTSLVLGNHRANAMLIGAPEFQGVLDDLLAGRFGAPPRPQMFAVVRSGSADFVIGYPQLLDVGRPTLPGLLKPPLLALSLSAIEPVMEACEIMAYGALPPILNLPAEPWQPASPESPYVMFRDGLALLLDWRDESQPFEWAPSGGPGIAETLKTVRQVWPSQMPAIGGLDLSWDLRPDSGPAPSDERPEPGYLEG